MTNFSTTRPTISGVRPAKAIVASSRLRNSGVNRRLIASSSSPSRPSRPKPIASFAMSEAPALVVMIRMTLRKSTVLPLWSVSFPWSITCSRMLNRSWMRLLDLVQQQHRVRMLVDRVGQQAALVEADIARRRADQPRLTRVPLHVLRHVEADQLDAHGRGQLPRHLGLADAGRAAEQVVADRLLRLAQAGAGQLDRRGQRLDRLVLAEHHRLQVALQVAQRLLVVGRHALRRDAGDLGDDLLDVAAASPSSAACARAAACGEAPTSSITSIALSGSLRSLMYSPTAPPRRGSPRRCSGPCGASRSSASGRAGS